MDRGITARIRRRLKADFGDQADVAVQLLERVESGNQNRERVIAAVVLGAQGKLTTLGRLVQMSHEDWRDVLVRSGLGNADWTT